MGEEGAAACTMRVTIREAAERLGVSPDTVKRRIKRGDLRATKEETPRGGKGIWMIDLPDDLPNPGAGDSDQARRLDDQVSFLRDQITFKDRQIADLHRLLDQAHRLLPGGSPAGVGDEAPAPAVHRASPPDARPWWRRVFR